MLPGALLIPALASPAAATLPSTRAHPVSGPVTVDGRLDEADYARHAPVSDFLRYRPTPGGAHASQTEVWFLQDDTHLYVGVRVSGVPGEVRAHISPREDVNADDQVGVYLDPFGDARTGYIFYTNLNGIQQDIRHAYGEWYMDWDTVWSSAGRRIEGGYEIEFAFPFRSLQYPETSGERGVAEQDWTVMVTRKIPSEGIKLAWPALQPRHPRIFEQGATLAGVRPSDRGAGVELIPVLALRGSADRGERGAAPLAPRWSDQWTDQVRPGLDARVGLTPDIGLGATVLPDFSQIEGDVQQIDLNQRFAFFYPEQRPFFLNGIDSFEDQNETLYTRSVVAPLYGVKVQGQAERLGLGVLQALDAQPGASIHERGTPGFSEAGVAGQHALNAFGRARWDLQSNSYLGLTAADKRLVPWGTDGAGQPAGAFNDVVAADAGLSFSEVWTLDTSGALSVAGLPGDTLSGHSVSGGVARNPALGTGGELWMQDIGPGYRNELGYLTQSGISRAMGEVFHTIALGDGDSSWEPQAFGGVVEERDRDGIRFAGLGQDLRLAGNHLINVEGAVHRYNQTGVTVDGWAAGGGYDALLNRFARVSVEGSTSRTLDYGELIPANNSVLEGGLVLRPTVGTRLDLNGTWQWFTPEGQAVQRAARYWTRFNWQLTREWGVRAIAQTTLSTDIADPSVQPSLLLTWIRNPGTEAYVGATGDLDTDGSGFTELGVFAKLSWLFRL